MTLMLILIFLLVASSFLFFRWRRTSWSIYTATIVIFFAVGCGWLPSLLLTPLQAPYTELPDPTWKTRNAIILLGMATEKIPATDKVEVNSFAYGRVAQTAALYRACKQSQASCKVIISGGDARGYGKPEAAVYADYLARLGVSNEDLLLEGRSMNTWQNAEFTSALLRSQNPAFDGIWLVSSAVHLTRSVLYFSRFNVTVTPLRADYLSAPKSPIPIGYNFALMDVALHEYAGQLRMKLYDGLGWNVTATRPGDI